MAERVDLVPYDPRWPALATASIDEVQAVLGSTITAIEHIGSTARKTATVQEIVDAARAARGLPPVPVWEE